MLSSILHAVHCSTKFITKYITVHCLGGGNSAGSAMTSALQQYVVKYCRVQYSDIAVQWNMWKCTVHSAQCRAGVL